MSAQEQICSFFNIDCIPLGSGAVSRVIAGPPVLFKLSALDTWQNKLFWQNKKAFYEFVSNILLSVWNKKPDWLQYIVVPFFWKELNGYALVVEPKLEGYMTVEDYLKTRFQKKQGPNTPMLDTSNARKIYEELLKSVAAIVSTLNSFQIKHNDLHCGNIMIKINANNQSEDIKTINDLSNFRIIDYDWVSFAHNNFIDVLIERYKFYQTTNPIQQRAACIKQYNDMCLTITNLESRQSNNSDIKIFEASLNDFFASQNIKLSGGKKSNNKSQKAADKPKKPRKVTNKSKLS